MAHPSERELAVFSAARQMPAGERDAFLDTACAGDPVLRQRVQELLQANEAAGDFLNAPAPGLPGPETANYLERGASEKVGDRIGHYKLLQQIGEGGCGVVYMAEQEEPVRRMVALKVIKLGMDTKNVIARFDAERQSLALMDHPNIAKVLDAGATKTGRPYFVMELVRGTKITDYCDEKNLSTRDRLDLFIQVCRAIQHAHQKGIIHRDIKPSNILVTLSDGVPVPKVIDFGIAKATHGKLTDLTLFTAFEQFIGTPAYMSPEQAEMSALDIDTRSDIYSLGVLLYELLTGQTPFDAKKLLQAGLDEIRRTIREQEPARPSTRLSTMQAGDLKMAARQRQTEPPRLIHLVRGDLDWIVMKALEKHRARRYETANGLAADIQRHLNDEPVVAGPPSNLYRLQKLVRRHRTGVMAGCLLLLVLVAGIIGTTWGLLAALHQQRESERQGRIARQTTEFLTGMFESIDPETAKLREITVREILDRASSNLVSAFPHDPVTELPIHQTLFGIYEKLGKADAALPNAEAALRLAKSIHGDRDNADTARSLDDLADCLRLLGRLDEALPKAESAQAMWRRLYPGDRAEIANGLTISGDCLHDMGRLDEALARHSAALAMRQRISHGEGAEVADSLDDVATCLAESGHLDEALAKYKTVLAMHQHIYPGDHPSVALDLDNLGSCLRALGQPDEALTKYEAALAMDERIYKGDHPSVAAELANLADCLQVLGKREEALAKSEAALAMNQRIYPGDHPLVAKGLSYLACCLESLGRWPEALAKHELALAMWQRVYQGDHPDVAFEIGDVARCLQYQGRYAEAMPKFEAALAMEKRIFKGDHPDVATALCNAALCLDYLGRATEALTEHQAALEMRQRIYHADHPDVVESLANLALCLEHLGRFDEALAKHDEALAMARRVYQGDNMEVARRLRDEALCLERMGRWSESLTNEEASLAMCQRIDPGDHPNLGILLMSIGDALNVRSQFADAMRKYEQAGAMFQRIDAAQPGNNIVRSGLARSLLKRGDLLVETGKTAEANTNYQSGLRVADAILAADAANAEARQMRLTFRLKLGQERAEAVISKILPRSEAERIDLRKGDVLVRYNGQPIVAAADLSILTGRAAGTGIALEIRRDQTVLKLAVAPGPLGVVCEDRILASPPAP